MRILISDGAEGSGDKSVQTMLREHIIMNIRCAWHFISKNMKSSAILGTKTRSETLEKLVYARTLEYDENLLEKLSVKAPLID